MKTAQCEVCCGECKFHKRGASVDSYHCTNPESSYYMDDTMYDDTCEEGEPR